AQLDDVWDPVSPVVRGQIDAAAHSNDALIRQAAVEALGRLGQSPDPALLGDDSKMVQRTAAWATRQAHSRHENLPTSDIATALASSNDRMRWGATRIFAAHFAALAKRPEVGEALCRLVDDPATVIRMNAIKGLWQLWFWSADSTSK